MSRRSGVLVSLVLSALALAGAHFSSGAQGVAAELPALAIVSPISGFTQPVVITHAGDASNRLFVVEQVGRVRVVKGGALLPTPFLDLSTRISTGGERGLLGLAFPPGYAEKGYFYVNYTDPAGDTVISRFRRSAANPDVADAASEQIVLTIDQPFPNHNGGQLAFGPNDGLLYIGMGDGGSGGDPGNRAQNPNELLGKLLRIDTETGSTRPYEIPAGNPFVGRAGFRPEIWALGLRNPWRFSFDRSLGDLYLADVGQQNWEEVNFQPASSAGGENYGWNILEGTHCFDPNFACSTFGLTMPVAEYNHTQGCSVTGGYVYRGTAFPRMHGIYFYADYCSGRIWGLRREAGQWQNTLLLDTSLFVSTFGEDEAGNLYVASHTAGQIFRLVDTTPPATPTPSPAPSPTTGTPTLEFSQASVSLTENCTGAAFTVTRTGSPDVAVSVEYVSSDGTAKQKSDYSYAAGRLTFAPGEVSKTFNVSVSEDAFDEADETATLALLNPSGGAVLGSQSTAALIIVDEDTGDAAPNPIEDPETFVCQHYHDFLHREPDAEGLNFWTTQIAAAVCGPDRACLLDRMENVSAAFFLSIEFQNTGYLVYRYEKASFDRQPRYVNFLRDTRRISEGVVVNEGDWEARLEQNKQDFTADWVARPEFRGRYDGKTNAQYVDELFANSDVTPAQAERDALVSGLDAGTETRATVLRKVASNNAVYNRQYNPAFVLIQYFGYLRRNPDDPPNTDLSGYNFWLRKLDEHTLPGEDAGDERVALSRIRRAQMVRAFIVSGEYRERFGRP